MGCCLSSSSRGESDESPTPTSPTHPILNRTTTEEAAQSHRNRPTTSRSGRHRQALAGVPLDVHYNQAVQPHIWRSTRREWTRGQLTRERELFFDTRVTGRPEVWAALKTATSLVRAGDIPTAQGILDAAGITVPTGDLCDGCYDESGVLYRVPEPIAMDPVNVIEEATEANDVNTICATTAELGEEDVEHNKLAVDVDSDDDTVDDIERRREEKGKVSERDLIKISARLSDRGGPDLTVMIGKNQTVGTLARRIQTEAAIASKHRVRIAYLGKILKEHETLLSQGWREGHVVNALVVISSRS